MSATAKIQVATDPPKFNFQTEVPRERAGTLSVSIPTQKVALGDKSANSPTKVSTGSLGISLKNPEKSFSELPQDSVPPPAQNVRKILNPRGPTRKLFTSTPTLPVDSRPPVVTSTPTLPVDSRPTVVPSTPTLPVDSRPPVVAEPNTSAPHWGSSQGTNGSFQSIGGIMKDIPGWFPRSPSFPECAIRDRTSSSTQTSNTQISNPLGTNVGSEPRSRQAAASPGVGSRLRGVGKNMHREKRNSIQNWVSSCADVDHNFGEVVDDRGEYNHEGVGLFNVDGGSDHDSEKTISRERKPSTTDLASNNRAGPSRNISFGKGGGKGKERIRAPSPTRRSGESGERIEFHSDDARRCSPEIRASQEQTNVASFKDLTSFAADDEWDTDPEDHEADSDRVLSLATDSSRATDGNASIRAQPPRACKDRNQTSYGGSTRHTATRTNSTRSNILTEDDWLDQHRSTADGSAGREDNREEDREDDREEDHEDDPLETLGLNADTINAVNSYRHNPKRHNVYIAVSRWDEKCQGFRVKIGHTGRELDNRMSEQSKCGLFLEFCRPMLNAVRVETMALMILKREFRQREHSGNEFFRSMSNYGDVVCECPKKSKHKDVFVTTSNDFSWLQNLVLACQAMDRKDAHLTEERIEEENKRPIKPIVRDRR